MFICVCNKPHQNLSNLDLQYSFVYSLGIILSKKKYYTVPLLKAFYNYWILWSRIVPYHSELE